MNQVQVTFTFMSVEDAIEGMARMRGLTHALNTKIETTKDSAKPEVKKAEATPKPAPAPVEAPAPTPPTVKVETAPAAPVLDQAWYLANLAPRITQLVQKDKNQAVAILNSFPHKDDATKPAGNGKFLKVSDWEAALAKFLEALQ